MRHLERTTKPDLSGRTSWRQQSRRTGDLRFIATNSQICASSASGPTQPAHYGYVCACGLRGLHSIRYAPHVLLPSCGTLSPGRAQSRAEQREHDTKISKLAAKFLYHPDSAVRVRNDFLQWVMGFSSLTRMGWIFVMARALKRLLLLF